MGFTERVEALLEVVRNPVGTDYATFSHVDDGTYVFEAVDAPGDADQLRQLLQNLLDNPLEYTGDAPPRIEITAERDGSEWMISVHDEGIGIPPDDQDRIFEVFQRGHQRKDNGGTSIGLAQCRRLVEQHGGEIWVESTPGDGATFAFSLPAASSNDE